MNSPLKFLFFFFCIAALFICAYSFFAVQPDVEEPALAIRPTLTEVAPKPTPTNEVPTKAVDEKPAEETSDIVELSELEKLEKDLEAFDEVLAENAKALYPLVMEVIRLSELGVVALRELPPIKEQIASTRNELRELSKQENMDGLRERQLALKAEMTVGKDLLREKEARVKELEQAYASANASKLKVQNERREHIAWQNELKRQINELMAEGSKIENKPAHSP